MTAPSEFEDLEDALAAAFDPTPGLISSWLIDATETGRGIHVGSHQGSRWLDTSEIRIALGTLRRQSQAHYKVVKAWYGMNEPTVEILQQLNMPLEQAETIRIESLVILREILFDGESSSPFSKVKFEFPDYETERYEEGQLVIILEGPLGGLSGQIIRYENEYLDRVHMSFFYKSRREFTIQNIEMLG